MSGSTALDFLLSSGGTLVFCLILYAPVVLLCGILVPVFSVKGYKKGTYRSLTGLGCSVGSALLSIPIAKGIAMLLSSVIYDGILKKLLLIPGVPDAVRAFFSNMTYTLSFVRAVITALTAGVVFVILFTAFLVASKIITDRLTAKRLSRPDAGKGYKLGGLFIAMADAFLIVALITSPAFTALGSFAETASGVTSAVDSAQEEDSNAIALSEKYTGLIQKSPMVRIAQLPVLDFGGSFFGSFTCKGERYSVVQILRDTSEISVSSIKMLKTSLRDYGEDEIDTLEEIAATAKKDPFFYGLISDVFSVSGEFLENRISASGSMDDTTSTQMDQLMNAMIEPLSHCSAAELMNSTDAGVAVLSDVIRSGALRNYNDKEKLTTILTDEKLIGNTVKNLRSTPLLSDVMNSALVMLFDHVNFTGAAESAEFRQSIEKIKATVKENMESVQPDADQETAARPGKAF